MSKQKRDSADLKRKIKEMEDEARMKAMAAASVTMVQPEGEDADKMSYDQWWMIAQSRVKLRSHLKEVVWADMKARGLSKKESQAKYDDALRLFGYSW